MKYWDKRQQQQIERLLDKSINDTERYLAKEYQRCLREVKIQLSDMYDAVLASTADGTLLVSDLYKYNRYYDLINSLNHNLQKLGYAEIKITEEHLKSMYVANSALIGDYLSLGTGYSEESAKRCINAIWCADGKHWSSRIWNNKTDLQNRIEKGIMDCVSRGVSKAELVKDLRQNMNIGFNQADRIARTELSYVQNQATKDKFIEAGIEKYQFLATHDDRTCDVCGELDGKIFYLRDARVGENYPPIHPNCRSTVLAVIE